MDLRGPLRPSDYHDFSQSIGEIGPYYTITFELWINSIRPAKAFVFRIGNSTIDPPQSTTFGPMAKRNADYDDDDDVDDDDDEDVDTAEVAAAGDSRGYKKPSKNSYKKPNKKNSNKNKYNKEGDHGRVLVKLETA